jgi:hypothetical protein
MLVVREIEDYTIVMLMDDVIVVHGIMHVHPILGNISCLGHNLQPGKWTRVYSSNNHLLEITSVNVTDQNDESSNIPFNSHGKLDSLPYSEIIQCFDIAAGCSLFALKQSQDSTDIHSLQATPLFGSLFAYDSAYPLHTYKHANVVASRDCPRISIPSEWSGIQANRHSRGFLSTAFFLDTEELLTWTATLGSLN